MKSNVVLMIDASIVLTFVTFDTRVSVVAVAFEIL